MNKIIYNKVYGGFTISKKVREWLENHGLKGAIDNYYLELDIARHDPLLVQAYEENVDDYLQTEWGCREIIGDKYVIKEYDGLETVIEPNDIHWITINN